MRLYKNKTAVTLIELMLVMIIISILSAMVFPAFIGRSKQAKIEAAKAQIESNISLALDMYELDSGAYPSTEQGLVALVAKPATAPVPSNWKGPYLKKTPKDPWGNDYLYAYPGLHNKDFYDLFSYGPDGIESQDDITNWENDTRGALEE
jgi:general secretion pathway protein G